MKIVNITGGLGNQMFQYAFALALKHRYPNEKILIDKQHYHSLFFKKFKGINLHNGFEINKIFPNASLPIAKAYDLVRISYWIPNYVLSRIGRKFLPKRKAEYIPPYSLNYSFDEKAVDIKGNCYYEGYWQCPKYFDNIKDQIISTFQFPLPNNYNKKILRDIESSLSVGIHVRRGDYLNEPEFRGICDINYYKEAILEIKENYPQCKFFIFSNDFAWCRENLIPLFGDNAFEFVTENKGVDSFWDMFLMTRCKFLIIANSSFSWWGAYLNENVQKVYAPYPWLNRDCKIDIYPNEWMKIECVK